MKTDDSIAVQSAKACVLDYCKAFDQAKVDDLAGVLQGFTDKDYTWRGLHPFHEHYGCSTVVDAFWKPLRSSFTALQRRVDIFFANHNSLESSKHSRDKDSDINQQQSVWTCQMGHFMGLMDAPWLDIPATGRMVFIRFVEFHRVHDGLIRETALFFDLISVMRQAGQYPLPPGTGASFIYPGPMTQDGVLLQAQPPQQGRATLDLINRMVDDLNEANRIAEACGDNHVPREVLARTWDERMLWYGPDGIGATYTIDRYQQQHQYPFRFNLSGKTFNGHVARFAEGNYGGFFGWPNLSNSAIGGFLGLPAGAVSADMRVVDVYRSDGHKLQENWVIIDLPHWLNMQGLDVLERMRQLRGLSQF